MPHYFVYIMTNRSKTLYTGVTGHLVQRVWQHKNHVNDGFTAEFKIDRLVYYERFADVRAAIAREKEIKGWLRIKKMQLIVSMNPAWKDLAADWYRPVEELKVTGPGKTGKVKSIGPSSDLRPPQDDFC